MEVTIKIKLRVEQNGGEYYGSVVISNVTDTARVTKIDGRTLQIDSMKLEFDELIDIIKVG